MKIVLVVDQFDDGNNGTTVTARRYAEQLRKRGHTVTILAGGEPGENKISVPIHRIPFFQKLIESQGMCFAKPVDEAYYQAFKDADVVHFYMPFRFCRRGEEIARQLGVPTVAAFHVQPENITSTIKLGKCRWANQFLYWWFYHVFYNPFRYIHCPSYFIAQQLQNHGYDAKLCVISNGVDDAFVPRKVEKPAVLRDKFTVLMIGRFSREKRQDLIIEAVKQSKYSDRIQLVFAGKGPKEAEYRKLAKGLKNEPVFGFYNKEELVELINSCDLYIHSSDAEIEGISCMEAVACGLVPVISDSPLSATKQFSLDDRCLFAAGDAQSLSERIDYWIEHPEEKAKLSQKYSEFGDTIRVSSCVKKAEEMYRQAIEDYRQRGAKRPKRTWIRGKTHPDADQAILQFCEASPARMTLMRGFTNLVSPLLLLIDRLFFGLTIRGFENLKDVPSGAVTICNHVHPMDCTMVKLAVFPRQLYYISLKRNVELPFVGWLVKLCGGLPLPDTVSMATRFHRGLRQHLQSGGWVHYYPEGMLVQYHEKLRPFHKGAFQTAVQAGVPVVPMRIMFSEPKGIQKLWHTKPVMTLQIAQPQFADMRLARHEAVQELMERTRAVMEDLDLRRGEYELDFESDFAAQ